MSRRNLLLLIYLIVAGAASSTGFAEDVETIESDHPLVNFDLVNESIESHTYAESQHDGCYSCDLVSGCDNKPWSVTFTQTVDFVTNLALPFQLTPANASVFRDDFQFQTNAGAYYQRQLGPDSSFRSGYSYYQNLHPSVNELDLYSHTALAQYSRRLSDRLIATLDYNYAYYFLESASFVSQNRAGITTLYSMNDCWDIKLRYEYLQSDFRIAPALDANAHTGQVELIRYLDASRKAYLTGGYAFNRWDAANDGFSYDLNSVFLAGNWLFGPCNQNELQVLAVYYDLDFDDFDPIETTVIRHDRIWNMTARLTRHVTDRLDVFAQYILFDDDSNVVRQDYLSNAVSVGITFEL